MAALFSVRSRKADDGCGATIRARDPDAKQTLFGWGSDQRPSIEFYGRSLESGGDKALWEFQLSAAGVEELRKNLADQIRRPKYYNATARDTRLAKTLKARLDTVAKSCARPKR